MIPLLLADGGPAGAFQAYAFFGLVLPIVIATLLLSVCRARGRESAQWLVLCLGSAIGTISGAYYGAMHGLMIDNVFTMVLAVGFAGTVTGILALPIATWLGDRRTPGA